MMYKHKQRIHKVTTILFAILLVALLMPQPAANASAAPKNGGVSGANIKDGVLLGYYGDGGDLVLPNTITAIAPEAFKDNDNVTSIAIPGSVSSIGYGAFRGCTALKKVTFPDSKDGAKLTIRVNAFEDCKALEEATIPACAKYVTANIFKGCSSLKEINVDPDNPYYCSKDGVLFGPTVNEGTPIPSDKKITLIGYPGGKKTGGYTIPSHVNGKVVNEVWASAFRKCTNLTAISFPATLKTIGGNAFDQTGLTSVTIPETVTDISDGIFEDCKDLVEVKLPSSVTKLGFDFFKGCTSLHQVSMDSVTSISPEAFMNCTSLTNLVLPEKVSSIEIDAFKGCSNLQRVYIPKTTINFPSDSYVGPLNVFGECSKNLVLYVIKGSKAESYASICGKEHGWSYRSIANKQELENAVEKDGSFALVHMRKKVKLTGDFSIYHQMNATDVTEGAAHQGFLKEADTKKMAAYQIDISPKNIPVPKKVDASIGIPKEMAAKKARLYTWENGKVTDTNADLVSKTLKATIPTPKYLAVIGHKDGSGQSEKPVDPISVTLNKETASVKVGKKITLTSSVQPSNAKSKEVTWTTSAKDIATVKGGVVTGVAPGQSTITATTINGKKAHCQVTVTDGSTVSAGDIHLEAPKIADADKAIPFGLFLKDASRISTVEISFKAETDAREPSVTVEGENGFQVVGTPLEKEQTYTAVLAYTQDDKLFNGDGDKKIATILINGKKVSVALTDGKIVGWKMDNKAVFGELQTVNTDAVQYIHLSPYDFNKDGKVDMEDVKAAEKHYRLSKEDSHYSQNKQYDVNRDGIIDIEDFIIVKRHMN